ncbi:MAG: BRCT domain-containing protein [Sarcina sp.]
MENMILIDLETRDFSVEIGGIYEVGAIVISNGKILEKLHLRIIEDESQISRGYGYGYENLSYNEEMISKFKNFIKKYNFPLVAHNAPFDRKFLMHFNWISDNYKVYDSIRALKNENLNIKSYSMSSLISYLGLSKTQSHTALDDTEVLFEILSILKPKKWTPLGKPSSTRSSKPFFPVLTALKKEFEVEKNIFNGKTIVFTGKSNYSRNTLIELAKKAGATSNSDRVTKKTNILVTGINCGSKLKKAQAMGLDIISVDEFIKIINSEKEVL